jgi:hypothetical protein
LSLSEWDRKAVEAPAAWPRDFILDFCAIVTRRPPRSCIADLLAATFRYARRTCVTWPDTKSQWRSRLLIVPGGMSSRNALLQSRAHDMRTHPHGRANLDVRTSAEDEASARHQAGCAIGDSCRRHSWVFNPFAGLIPSAGDLVSPQNRACVLFD